MISKRTILSGAAIGVAATFGLAVLAMPLGPVLAARRRIWV